MKPAQKVLIFLPHLTYGGAERQGYLLAEGLHKNGFEVEVWGFPLHGSEYPLAKDLAAIGIKTANLPFNMAVFNGRWSQLKAFISFTNLVRKNGFHVIIPFTYWCNFLAGITSFFTGVKCFWNQRSVDTHLPVRSLEKYLPLKKLLFVSNSNPGIEFIENRFQLAKGTAALIPNSIVDVSPKNPPAFWREKLDVSQQSTVVTMVANYYPEKDFVTVLKAVHILKTKGLNAVCVLVGNGHESHINKVKALAFDLDLHSNIRFVHGSNDVAGILSITDIGLLSSTSEGCPNSILEYMNIGLPVVANNINAIADVLGAGYPYLFETQNEQSLSNKLQQLISDSGLRKQMGAQLKLKVTEQYNHEKMVNAYIRLITGN